MKLKNALVILIGVAFVALIICRICGIVYGQQNSQYPNTITWGAASPQDVSSVTAQVIGTTGRTTYYYHVIANYPIGKSGPGGVAQVINAPNILSGANYVQITWTPIPGVISYDVLRTTTPNIPNPCVCAKTTLLVGSSYNDVAAAVAPYTLTTIPNVLGSISLDNQNYFSPLFISDRDFRVKSNLFVDGNVTASSALLTPSTIASLPLASSVPYQIRVVNDGVGSTDCTIGGGASLVGCISDSIIWKSFSGVYPGAVVMVPVGLTDNWLVFKASGSLVNTIGTTTSGLQEAINEAHSSGKVLRVFGGWIGAPINHPAIITTTTVTFPTQAISSYHFYGVNFWYNGSCANDAIVIDTQDMTDIDWHDSQMVNSCVGAGDSSVIRFLPQNDNGEDFVGYTSSRFRFGSIVAAAANLGMPNPAQGYGIRFTLPLSAPHVAGRGLTINCDFSVAEIHGGKVGLLIDDPVAPNTFQYNHITAPAIHGQGTYGVQVGVTNASNPLIYGNNWNVIINPTAGVSFYTWGNNDQGMLTLAGGIGLQFNGSAAGNSFYVSQNSAAIPVTDNVAARSNTIIGRAATPGGIGHTISNGPSGRASVVTHTLTLESSTQSTLTLNSPDAAGSNIFMGSPTNAMDGGVSYWNPGRYLAFSANGTEQLRLSANGTSIFIGPNYIAVENGANNAIAGSVPAVPLIAGLQVQILLAHTLVAGGNTFAYNGGAALAIKSHRNVANNIGTGYAAGGIITLMYDGTRWEDMSQ